MLKKIELNNFQCYKHAEVYLTKGVNVIVGCSHVGKTSLLRALYWVLFNQPSGDSIRRHDTQETSVALYADGLQGCVTRVKGSKVNAYVLNRGEDRLEYNAIGMGKVPDDIDTILNMQPVNIQKQMDEPFLLSKTPGEVMRMVNKICNLERMDKYVSVGNSDIRDINIQIKATEQSIVKVQETLKKYTGLKKQKILLDALVNLDTIISKKERSVSCVDNILKSFWDAQYKIESYTLISKRKKVLSELRQILLKHTKCTEKLKTICGIVQNIHDISSKITDMSRRISIKNKLHTLIVSQETIMLKEAQLKNLQHIVHRSTTCTQEILRWKKCIFNCKLIRDEIREKLAEETCPTCRQKINPNLL